MVEQPSCSRQSSQDDVDCSSAVGVKPSGRFLYSIHFIVWFFLFFNPPKICLYVNMELDIVVVCVGCVCPDGLYSIGEKARAIWRMS